LELPRLWIILNKEIIFDFLKDYKDMLIPNADGWYRDSEGQPCRRVYYCEVTNINTMIHAYIETPATELFDLTFEDDHFGFCDILKAADKRIGKNRLLLLKDKTTNQAAIKIIDERLKKRGIG
jgi:hypothetical protein